MRLKGFPLLLIFAAACDSNPVTWEGVGPLMFGMTRSEAVKVLGAVARAGAAGAAGSDSSVIPGSAGCDYARLTIAGEERLIMIEDNRLVRLDVNDGKTRAPGGGKVGMTVDVLRRTYGAELRQSPHKYVQGASYFTLTNGADSTRRIVFEVVGDSVATWRIGITPQVEYVERCG